MEINYLENYKYPRISGCAMELQCPRCRGKMKYVAGAYKGMASYWICSSCRYHKTA